MKLDELLNKTCLVGLSYFGTQKELLEQVQHAGEVRSVDEENGISITLMDITDSKDKNITTDKENKIFVLPPLLTPWFNAPAGVYKNAAGEKLIENPDFFVTWDIYKTQNEKQGDHEWWEWIPRTTPPKVN